MKEMDSIGLRLCNYQAILFDHSVEGTNCSSRILSRRFMNSNLAERMDNAGFLFESSSIPDAFRELEEQYGESSYGREKFTVEELHWIGYIYRYWAYVREKPSQQLYKFIKPEELRKLYFPYHSLDPLQAIERIEEDKGLDTTEALDDIARGVIILRKARSRKQPLFS